MTVIDIIKEMTALQLPRGEYIVFGSCPLAAAGIRGTEDIDLFISDELHDRLVVRGWQQNTRQEHGHDRPIRSGIFDAHTDWHIGSYNPTLAELMASATFVEGIPFAALIEVRRWKAELRRPKDEEDIRLIDAYLAATGRL